MINSSAFAQSHTDAYTDLSSVQAIRQLEDKNQALEKVAQQFESMMLRMVMKSMRSANEVFAEGNYLSSKEGNTYRDMLDDQLSLTLSEGRGLGIAEVLVRQLKGRYGDESATHTNTAATAALPERRDIPQTFHFSGTRTEATETQPDITFDGSVQQFVDRLYPMAEKAAAVLGVSPEVLIAQSALETGWGKKVTGSHNGDSSLNFFNIKANKHWNGPSVTVSTLEIRNGIPVRELGAFRAYESAQQSFDDYVDFISGSSRYEKALACGDGESYIRALAEGGYATDTEYAEKVIRIMNSADLKTAVANANAAQHTDGEG